MTYQAAQRPSDGVLVRYLDDEMGADERARFQAALAEDPELREALRAFEAASASFASAVDKLHLPRPPALGWLPAVNEARGTRWARAAVIVLLGAALIGVSPLRAAVGQGIMTLVEWLQGGSPILVPATGGGGVTVVRGAMPGSSLTLSFEGVWEGSSLRIRQSGDHQVGVWAPATAETLFSLDRIVFRDGVEGTPTRKAQLVVEVPRHVAEVFVRHPSGRIESLEINALPTGLLELESLPPR